MEDVRLFLKSLFAQKPDNTYILLWERLERKLSYWFREWEQAADFAEAHNVNIYTGVALSPADYGPYQRCKSADASGMIGLYADVDYAGDGHKTKELPPDETSARLILPPELKPSMVIHSGHGLQAWWLLDKPNIFANADARTQNQELAKRWDRLLKNRAAKYGWTVDSVFDFARVLRVPGTINRKEGLPDAWARIIEVNPDRYAIETLAAFLAQAPSEPDRPRVPILAPAVGEIQFRPWAEFNAEVFAALWENDLNFRLTWSGRRPDLKDQSQSSYDLALANTLWDAQVPDQTTADAIVHFRRLRNAPAKPNPLYYLRKTISTARDRTTSPPTGLLRESIESVLTGKLPAGPDPIGTAAKPKIHPAVATAMDEPKTLSDDDTPVLESLNMALNIRTDRKPNPIMRAVRVPAGKNTTWRIELEDGKIATMEADAQWATYQGFASLVRTQLGNTTILIPNKKNEWDRKVLPLFNHCWVDVDGGAEADAREYVTDALDSYLAERGVWEKDYAWEEPNRNLLPILVDGRIAVYAPSLGEWIARSRNERRPEKEICAGLSAIGGIRRGINRPGRTSQSRWILPKERWDAQVYIELERRHRTLSGGSDGKRTA